MKKELKICIILWSLILTLGAIGLGGCDKDDYLTQGVYQGYIEDINQESDFFTIRITDSPYNVMVMPLKQQLIAVDIDDFSNVDIKIQQKLSFNILSADALFIPAYLSPEHYIQWDCKIKIIKIY